MKAILITKQGFIRMYMIQEITPEIRIPTPVEVEASANELDPKMPYAKCQTFWYKTKVEDYAIYME